jgi:riboflavin synthase
MFTGIIESLGQLKKVVKDKENLHLTFQCDFSQELKVDQSLAHNGVCLTVVDIVDDEYTVTAVKETMDRSNLGQLKPGDVVNLERCMKVGDRLDGHIVQGHVDTTAVVSVIIEQEGSTKFVFKYKEDQDHITVEKGSVCVNGVSLTVVDSYEDGFSVVIIPYTIAHTNFHTFSVGTIVNLEFDIIGKYILKKQGKYHSV